MSKVLLLQGNQAVVEGAIAAGVKILCGLPHYSFHGSGGIPG
mgnify:CR=1 FL=1